MANRMVEIESEVYVVVCGILVSRCPRSVL